MTKMGVEKPRVSGVGHHGLERVRFGERPYSLSVGIKKKRVAECFGRPSDNPEKDQTRKV